MGGKGGEDSAVPPEELGNYLRDIYQLLEKFGYTTPMYGHFGQGCVHMRITFDLETAPGIAKFREFIDQAADIVLAHGGSLSGEHGRWPGTRGAAAEDVWAGVDEGVSGIQGALGSG